MKTKELNASVFLAQFENDIRKILFSLKFSEKAKIEDENFSQCHDEDSSPLMGLSLDLNREYESYKRYIRGCCLRDVIEHAFVYLSYICEIIESPDRLFSEIDLIKRQINTLLDRRNSLKKALDKIENALCSYHIELGTSWKQIRTSLEILYEIRNSLVHHMGFSLKGDKEIAYKGYELQLVGKDNKSDKFIIGNQPLADAYPHLEPLDDGNFFIDMKLSDFTLKIGQNQKIILTYTDTHRIFMYVHWAVTQIANKVNQIIEQKFDIAHKFETSSK